MRFLGRRRPITTWNMLRSRTTPRRNARWE
jgi:hypothetical protein